MKKQKGRTPLNPKAQTHSISIPPDLRAELQRLNETRGINISRVAQNAFRRLIAGVSEGDYALAADALNVLASLIEQGKVAEGELNADARTIRRIAQGLAI